MLCLAQSTDRKRRFRPRYVCAVSQKPNFRSSWIVIDSSEQVFTPNSRTYKFVEEKGRLLQRLKLSLQLTRFSWLKLILFVVCMHVLCSIAWFKFVSERIALSQIEITFALSVTCSCVTTPGNNVHDDVHVLKNMANLSALGCRSFYCAFIWMRSADHNSENRPWWDIKKLKIRVVVFVILNDYQKPISTSPIYMI